MNHYFIANIRINDSEEYQKYLNKVDDVCGKYNIDYIAVDESPLVLEGSWNYTKSVVMKFDSREDFEKWYYSADYQKILKFRLNAADCDTILIKGLE